jgi:hypothetical protein
MKEIVRCVQCGCTADTLYKCDTCGESNWLPNLTLIVDLEEYHFCNYQCLLKFIVEELKKEKLND